MDNAEIVQRRLRNQRLVASPCGKPEEVVAWLGAMQAQEWAMAKWAIALRLPGCAETDVEAAFNRGAILRTHVLRPTWHFVAPADIVWMLALSAPRVHALNAYMYRKVELDTALLKRSRKVLEKALAGGPLTRAQLSPLLEEGGIKAEGLRLGYLFMHAELEGLICSGPRVGKQFTYALIADRAPKAKPLPRQDALAELSSRYFASRGPATVQDFSAWSGFSVKDCREGAASLDKRFVRETVAGKEYLFIPDGFAPAASPRTSREPTRPAAKAPSPIAHGVTFLLPDYDELGMAYKDRSAYAAPMVKARGTSKRTNIRIGDSSPISDHMVVVDGLVRGTWRRTVTGKGVQVETDDFSSLGKAGEKAVKEAVERYRAFFAGNPE